MIKVAMKGNIHLLSLKALNPECDELTCLFALVNGSLNEASFLYNFLIP